MLEKQIECLEKSINEKWIPIVEGRHRESSGSDCACCKAFYCSECPIGQDIGDNCGSNLNKNKSSYWLFHQLKRMVYSGNIYDLMFDLKAAAQMELDYLIDLRDRLKGRLYEMEQIEDARPGPGK